MDGLVWERLRGVVGLCSHKEWDYINRLPGADMVYDSGFVRASSYVKCRGCGRVLVRKHIFEDIISHILLLERGGMVRVSFFNTTSNRDMSINELLRNIRKGVWFLGDDNLKNSLLYTSQRIKKIHLMEKQLENKSEEDLKFDIYGQHHRNLTRNGITQVSLDHSRIFLQMLSSVYGYEKARAKWSWEADTEKKVMIFSKRLKKRQAK